MRDMDSQTCHLGTYCKFGSLKSVTCQRSVRRTAQTVQTVQLSGEDDIRHKQSDSG